MDLEIKKLGISLNDNSLRKLIKSDKMFYKDEKFSREYILQKEDKIFVISYSRPNLNEIL